MVQDVFRAFRLEEFPECLVEELDGRIHLRLFLVDRIFLAGGAGDGFFNVRPKLA